MTLEERLAAEANSHAHDRVFHLLEPLQELLRQVSNETNCGSDIFKHYSRIRSEILPLYKETRLKALRAGLTKLANEAAK